MTPTPYALYLDFYTGRLEARCNTERVFRPDSFAARTPIPPNVRVRQIYVRGQSQIVSGNDIALESLLGLKLILPVMSVGVEIRVELTNPAARLFTLEVQGESIR